MYPILVSTPWFNLYSYGLLIAIGYSLSTYWIIKEAKKDGLPGETIFDMLILQLIIGIFGSRLLFILEYTPDQMNFSSFFAFEQGGLTFYGSVISGTIFNLFFLKLKRLPFWRVMDCVGFGLPLLGFARIGCFLNGCCYGIPCKYPWGVVFPKVSTESLHPTQLYEVISGIIIFIALQKLRRYRQNYGEVFLTCMIFYGFCRFFIEFWRADNPVFALGLQLSQIIAILIISASVAIWKLNSHSKRLRIIPSDKIQTTVKSK